MSSLFGDTLDPEPENNAPTPLDAEEEGLQGPIQSDFCLGHNAIEDKFLNLITDNKLPHGLVFSGIKGIGKSTFAYRLVKFLLAQPVIDPNQNSMFADDVPAAPTSLDSDPNNTNIKLLLAGAHPDCMILQRTYDDTKKKFKDSIDIAEIRKINPFLHMTSSNGGWRIVLIDDADTMNRNAQNALLKILEEPPKKTLIILVAHRFGMLIPTIKSRIQHIHFAPLDTDTMRTLQNKATMPTLSPILMDMAMGSFGRLQELAEEGGEETLQTALEILSSCPKWDWPKIHKLTDPLIRAGQDTALKLFQTITHHILWTITQSKARDQNLPESLQNHAGIAHIMQNNDLHTLIDKTDNLQSLFDRGNFANLDKKTTLLQAIALIST